ncbi:flagellar hook-basal body complex protein FliE [Scopulibacillus darangshiensis]|uniref:Flagellar hook-basal body complex protein FliE n=1 Tax=Scopulibacillus darangshiensis TaxID=442528 RepID=A0A4R2P5E2_9BACL|nr:flagellar hook-basal body complex protein FliE [Scopulibacillus darangshiensis]TCP29181.1 flagellar hook-basal body complex protein FliE [Scopulibacillus darangshiensis]
MKALAIDLQGLKPAMEMKHLSPKSKVSFSNMLGKALDNVNVSEETANQMVTDMAAGKAGNLHNVMIAMEKSDILLQTTVEVRNKVIDAYQEIMRMQV